jgi:hypothetical protein
MAALFLAHLLAGLGLWPTALPIWLKAALWLVLALSLCLAWRRRPPMSITLNADGRLTLTMADQSSIDCRVLPATTVFPWLVTLVLESAAGRRTLALPVDAVGGEAHRRLRSWLRWQVTAGAE